MAKKSLRPVPRPPVDTLDDDQADVVTSASAQASREEALSKGPARHQRSVPAERRHGVRAVPSAAPPKPEGFQEYPKMLYPTKAQGPGRVVADAKEHAVWARKGYSDEPTFEPSSHRHIEGA